MNGVNQTNGQVNTALLLHLCRTRIVIPAVEIVINSTLAQASLTWNHIAKLFHKTWAQKRVGSGLQKWDSVLEFQYLAPQMSSLYPSEASATQELCESDPCILLGGRVADLAAGISDFMCWFLVSPCKKRHISNVLCYVSKVLCWNSVPWFICVVRYPADL